MIGERFPSEGLWQKGIPIGKTFNGALHIVRHHDDRDIRVSRNGEFGDIDPGHFIWDLCFAQQQVDTRRVENRRSGKKASRCTDLDIGIALREHDQRRQEIGMVFHDQ